MSKRKYPRTEFVVTPAGNVKQVTLEKLHMAGSAWDLATNGKSYHTDQMHPTKHAAIMAERAKIAIAEARLATSRANLDKKIANLKKAEAA